MARKTRVPLAVVELLEAPRSLGELTLLDVVLAEQEQAVEDEPRSEVPVPAYSEASSDSLTQDYKRRPVCTRLHERSGPETQQSRLPS